MNMAMNGRVGGAYKKNHQKMRRNSQNLHFNIMEKQFEKC